MTGRTVIVTGANSGIGRAAAAGLADAGARVVLAVRNTDRGNAAAAAMHGHPEVRQLDLASLASIGPGGLMEMRGEPKLVDRSGAAKDTHVARRLWDVSEHLTGTPFPLATAAEGVEHGT